MLVILFYGVVAMSLLFISLILYARRNYGFLESLGIPVEPPTLFLGSCPYFYRSYPQYEDIKKFQKYGSVFGVYEGSSPQIMIADPELIKLIMVKDYEHFHSRSSIDLGHSIANEILDYLPANPIAVNLKPLSRLDEKWKIVRRMLTPQMTTSRLKSIAGVTLEIANEFAKDLSEECQGDRMKIDFRNRVAAIMLNVVTSALYGMQIENPRDPNNSMVKLMKSILCEDVVYDFRYTLILVFPFLKKLFPKWPFPAEGLDKFRLLMESYLKTRRQEIQKRNDFGEAFVDMMNLTDDPEFKKIGFTAVTAISQVVEIFFASFDTIGTSIAMLVYYLADNPDAQDRVIEEVDTIWDQYDGDLKLEAVGELHYMTACITESMRLAPSFIRPERKCTKAWTGIRDNGLEIKIPKDANVVFPIWALHRHPQYFPDPEKFDPERFMPENKQNIHPYAFSSFGHGPKNCIGMKYAYNSVKIIMCRLYREFKFELRSDTKLEYKRGTVFFTQFGPLYFDLVRRSKKYRGLYAIPEV